MKITDIPYIENPKLWYAAYDVSEPSNPKWIDIAVYPWGGTYRPRSMAAICRSENGLHIVMRAYETDIRMQVKMRNGPVYTDSCMEFFFSPMPDVSPAYFNFEINPAGVLYIGFSEAGTRETSAPLDDAPDNAYFSVRASAEAVERQGYWQISYEIPYAFIQKKCPGFLPETATYIRGNFYKCADAAAAPHYGAWNGITAAAPDFHRLDCFGRLNWLKNSDLM